MIRTPSNVHRMARFISEVTGLEYQDCVRSAHAVAQYFHDSLLQGTPITIPGIGRLSLKVRKGRTCTKGNVKWLNIPQPDYWRIKLSPDQAFTDELNRRGKFKATNTQPQTAPATQPEAQPSPNHD